MRKWQRLVLVVLLGAPCAAGPAALAQEPDGDVLYTRHPVFKIPWNPDRDGAQRLRQLRLFYSTDRGRTWQAAATNAPNQRAFRFEADRDGLYWFAVQTQDLEGRFYPARTEDLRPGLRVFVDTHPPVVDLEPLPARGGEVGVAWKVTDDSPLDLAAPGAFRLEYRPAAGGDWQPLPADPAAGRYFWAPRADGRLEVRLRARDRAENWGEKKVFVDGGFPAAAPADGRPATLPEPSRGGPAPDGPVRMVNTKEFTLSYDVKDVGPSKVSTVDVWYTQDGNNWQKYRTQKCSDDPEARPPYALTIKVQEEGLYGFTLVVRSGVGLSERPPQVGDKPQVWVEVDTTRPEVRLGEILVGRGANKGKLFIAWAARDKNLGPRPITLSYATAADGPWTPVAEKVANTGQYVWTMPADVPYQFLVRAEAVDRAGNVGSAVTAELVKVDLAQPKAQILGVEPAGK